MSSLSTLALQDLHNHIIQQISSMSGKHGIISTLNQYNDELERRGEKSLHQNISRLISDLYSSKVDNIWVIDKIQGFLRQEYSKTYYEKHQGIESKVISGSVGKKSSAPENIYTSNLKPRTEQEDFKIDTRNWSKMSNWLIIDNLLNQFRTITDVDVILNGLDSLRNHLSSTLSSKKLYQINSFINGVKSTRECDLYELTKLFREIQNEYR